MPSILSIFNQSQALILFQLKPEKTIIEVWSDPYVMSMAVAAGYRVVFAQCWYLDHVHGQRPDWEDYYNCDPKRLYSYSSSTGREKQTSLDVMHHTINQFFI